MNRLPWRTQSPPGENLSNWPLFQESRISKNSDVASKKLGDNQATDGNNAENKNQNEESKE